MFSLSVLVVLVMTVSDDGCIIGLMLSGNGGAVAIFFCLGFFCLRTIRSEALLEFGGAAAKKGWGIFGVRRTCRADTSGGF